MTTPPKLTILILSIGVALSLLIFMSYSQFISKVGVDRLGKAANLSKVSGSRTEKFKFYVSSTEMNAPRIEWKKVQARCSARSLKLSFFGINENYFVGIRLNAALLLRSYKNDSAIEFWVKGGKNCALINHFKVNLRDWPGYIGKASVSFPISLSQEWQRVSLPMKSFLLEKRSDISREDFTWNIIEISFSVNSFKLGESADVYIDCLKILKNNEIISELF